MKKYFSVDCEFSGLNHRKNCLLSIGIVEIIKEDGLFKPLHNKKLYLELKPTGDIDPESMKINKLNIQHLSKYGINKDNAIREIKKFLNLNKDDTAIFIGYCNVLDKIFIDQLFQDCNKKSPFHYETIEISSLAIGKLGLEWGFTEEELLNKLNLSDLPSNKKHKADEDAFLQAKEFCKIMNY
jgi:oligoribonuclease (3'-5' exoribonuclease)